MQRQHVEYLLERLPFETPLEEVTPERIEQLLEQERAGRLGKLLSGGTLRKRASTLSQALELAQGRAPELPEIPYCYKPSPVYLETFDDYERLRDRFKPRRRRWFVTKAWTGQRRSDVERMVREDFYPLGDEPWVVVRSTKTRRGRVRIHAAPELVRELGEHWEGLEPGQKLVEPWPHANSDLRYHCKRLGLPLMSTKALRHTFFTWYVAANGFSAELLEIGGWRDMHIPSRVYAHALPSRFRDQIERTVAVATSLRRGPQKSLAKAKAGTTPLATVAKGSGAEEVAASSAPDTSPGPRSTGVGSERKLARPMRPGELVPRDRVELSTHGFSVRRDPTLAPRPGLPHGGKTPWKQRTLAAP